MEIKLKLLAIGSVAVFFGVLDRAYGPAAMEVVAMVLVSRLK